MTIHFAAARPPISAFTRRFAGGALARRAANDNGSPRHDRLLRDTLTHFARYGLRAAAVAREMAEQAHRAEDDEVYRHWLEICRALDQRMAGALRARIERRGR